MFKILGISPSIQRFFLSSIYFKDENSLIFKYGNDYEYYSPDAHLIPSTNQIWSAGHSNQHLIRQVFICQSAMEAISYLALNISQYRTTNHLLFLAVGNHPNNEQYLSILKNFKSKKISLIMGKELLGRISDLKIAVGLQQKKVEIKVINSEVVEVNFHGRSIKWSYDSLTLNSFEKCTGFRSGIRTYKSKFSNSFLNELTGNLS